MSLQVWLPLNGTLKNQGLASVNLTSGTPTYTTGKIGQCLATGSLTFAIDNNVITNLSDSNIYSMCCWCKNLDTSASSRWVFQISSGTGTTRGLWESNNTTARYWAYSGTGVNINTSINTIDGNWHHICFTSGGSIVKLYVDGIYQAQITNGSTTAMTTNTCTLNASNYNLNDFRVYDHCLSPMEVKELAKGLVLHYPLNQSTSILTNLSDTIEYDCSGYCNNGKRVGTFTWSNDTPKYQVSTNFNNTTSITSSNTYDTTLILPEYTIAVWVKTSSLPSTASYFYKGLIDLYFSTSGNLSYMYGISSSSGSGSSITYTLGEWVYMVITKDNVGVLTVYINGVNEDTITRDMYARYTTDVLGYNNSFTGQLSDFRIYATALSADDIEALYKDTAYIDGSGNFYGPVFSEVN